MPQTILRPDENILFSLRSLYGMRGYSQYKMNKFEEYDLYAHNKDFLISDSVITFTDGSGKLLALKPDVTLSIVKNTRDSEGELQKLYYNENVYRVSKGSRNFKEIMQVGLECIGNVDAYCVYEVLKLAAESLDVISKDNVLGVSHVGILSELADNAGITGDKKDEVFRLIGEKNLHELSSLLDSAGNGGADAELLKKLTSMQGSAKRVLPEVTAMLRGHVSDRILDGFEKVVSALSDEENINIDFSVVDDIRYYSGFVFKGFVEGIPTSVLSGGQYDKLMCKMGRSSNALGFAVYLDALDRFNRTSDEYDIDVVLIYDDTSSLREVDAKVSELTRGGESVLADTSVPEKLKYRRLVRLNQ